MASCGGGALCTIVPASWAACPAVVDRRLQVLFFGYGGCTCAGWWTMGWCGGAGAGAGAGSASASPDLSAIVATASDRAAIAQLMASVERLTAELVTVNTKLVTVLKTE